MSLTITIPGAVNVTTGAMAPAVLTIGVGVPGAQGPQGPAGQGVPVGGTAGQFLTKIDGTNYNTDWTTVNLSAYAVKANNLSDLTSASTARTNLGLGTMATASASSYSTTAVADTLYAPIAAGTPTGGTVGQVLTKNSGTDYDDSWQTLIPGDRYLTSSTTSLTINNANKTLTIGTGLSYSAQQDIVISYDAANHMHARVLTYNPSTGVMDVDVLSHSGAGTYAAWTVNVGGAPALASVVWGDITGTLGNQTDLATALNAKLEVTTAASTYQTLSGMSSYLTTSAAASTYYPLTNPYNFITSAGLAGYATESWVTSGFYPLTGNPSSFLVAADIAGKANIASPALTGNVTITSNSSGAALFIEQSGTGNILTLHDQASDTTFVAIDQNGKVSTIPSTTAGAGFNIAHGVAPTSPADGDVWSTTGGLFWRQNAATKQAMNLGDTQTVSGNITFSNTNLTFGSANGGSTTNVATGPTNSGATKAVNIGTAGVSGSTTNITVGPVLGASTTSIGNTTAASTLNLATGATLTATTKAVNIGTSGVAGSTTTIAIGSTTGTSTTTLQGNTNGVTQTAGNNTTLLATTAFVQQEVPAASTTAAGKVELATLDEAILGASTTLVPSAFSAKAAIMSADWMPVPRPGFTATTSGTGAACTLGWTNTFYQLPTSGTTGHSYARTYGIGQVDQLTNLWADDTNVQLNFAKRIWISGRTYITQTTTAYGVHRVSFGKQESSGVGDLAVRGIGWKYTTGASQFLQLMVHNGTTLTTVNSSFSPTDVAFDWDIVSEGNGNVTLYINGASVATTSAGPSTRATSSQCLYQEEAVVNGTIPNAFCRMYSARGAIYVQR